MEQALKGMGVWAGDRFAGVVFNTYKAIKAMLVAASIEATWPSTSPDFGMEKVGSSIGLSVNIPVLVAPKSSGQHHLDRNSARRGATCHVWRSIKAQHGAGLRGTTTLQFLRVFGK